MVVQAPEEALLGLWFGLLRGCDDAMAAAISAGKPAKDAVLDFYGVPVKAQDVRQFVDRMRLLADKVWVCDLSATTGGYNFLRPHG